MKQMGEEKSPCLFLAKRDLVRPRFWENHPTNEIDFTKSLRKIRAVKR